MIKCKILTIAEDAMEIMMLRRSLDAMNIFYELIEASNSDDALIILGRLADENKLPDVIFTDVTDSKVNGVEFLNIINSTVVLNEIPTIIITSFDTHPTMTMNLSIEILGYIRKKMNYNAYLEKLQSFMASQNCQLKAS